MQKAGKHQEACRCTYQGKQYLCLVAAIFSCIKNIISQVEALK